MVPRDVARILFRLCEEADTPRSLGMKLCLENDELDQILEMRADPLSCRSSGSYFRDALVCDILRKCRGLVPPKDLVQKATQAFWESEATCYRTNERLTPFLYGACPEGSERIMEVLSMARKYVSFMLGACPILPQGRFGPGSTFADRGFLVTVPDKMSSVPTLTAQALGVLPSWGKTAWARAVSGRKGLLNLVRGNRFTTVPKDSVKDRGIAVEPSINVFYQLAYGGEIRRRLKGRGVDLNNLQVLHRALAQEASSNGSLATIDLSNASDTLCTALVKLLLPDNWFKSLNSLRSPFSLVEGKWVRLEKFSSMGNGFTFELETLVFQALVFSVLTLRGSIPLEGKNFSVFGDDIIIPTDSFSDVSAALQFFGFTLNRTKSFSFGPFRESCGGDYFDGRPVRAHFLKEFPSEPHEWIAFCNGIRRVVCDFHGVTNPDSFDMSSPMWFEILNQIPSRIRELTGPSRLGDIVIHRASRHWRPQTRLERNGRLRPLGSYDPKLGDGIRYFKTWSPVHVRRVGWNNFQPSVVLATALLGVGDGAQGVTPRDAVLGYGESWVPSS